MNFNKSNFFFKLKSGHSPKLLGWSLVVLILGLFVLPFYVQEGMFFDGVTYAAIAHNQYLGYGTFWTPYYNEIYQQFFIQPPLLYGILSKFYYVFGSSIYTERIYNCIVLLLTIFIIRKFWIKMNAEHRKVDWLPILLWASSPLIMWSYRCTLLENTLTIFTLIAIYLLWIASENTQNKYSFIFIAGILVFLAFITKGFVGLFPLSFFVLHGLIYKKRIKNILLNSLFLCCIAFACFIITILFSKEAFLFFQKYYYTHVLAAVTGHEEITSPSKTYLILKLLLELSPFLVASLIGILFCKKKSLPINYKSILLLTLIGISASFPLFISPKQRAFYLVPCFPYFMLATAFIIYPLLNYYYLRFSKTIKKYALYPTIINILIAALIILLSVGNYSREEKKIRDVYKLSAYLPKKTIIKTPTDLALDWSLGAYLSRIGVLTPTDRIESKYMMFEKNDPFLVDPNYVKVNLDLEKYELYMLK